MPDFPNIPAHLIQTPGNGSENLGADSHAIRDLLVRVYERQRAVNDKLDGLGSNVQSLANKFDNLSDKFVTQVEFWPIKTIVYGGAGLILVAVVGALIALVIINRSPSGRAMLRGGGSSSGLASGWQP